MNSKIQEVCTAVVAALSHLEQLQPGTGDLSRLLWEKSFDQCVDSPVPRKTRELFTSTVRVTKLLTDDILDRLASTRIEKAQACGFFDRSYVAVAYQILCHRAYWIATGIHTNALRSKPEKQWPLRTISNETPYELPDETLDKMLANMLNETRDEDCTVVVPAVRDALSPLSRVEVRSLQMDVRFEYERAGKEMDPDPLRPELDQGAWNILRALYDSPNSMIQIDIAEAVHLGLRTVGRRLADLRAKGFVHRPKGKKHSDTLTEEGRELVEWFVLA